jgi:hypothetical protein
MVQNAREVFECARLFSAECDAKGVDGNVNKL